MRKFYPNRVDFKNVMLRAQKDLIQLDSFFLMSGLASSFPQSMALRAGPCTFSRPFQDFGKLPESTLAVIFPDRTRLPPCRGRPSRGSASRLEASPPRRPS